MRPLPRHVAQEFQKYLRCGILAWGFTRAHCRSCEASMLVAFSCKLRGVCPSCGARRASQTAANLVDRVLPRVALRQWVLSTHYELRVPMARCPALLSAVVRILCAEISRLMRQLGQQRGVRHGATGIVATIQFFGGSLHLNPYAH
ncbi:MAG TPA: transposase zinc-binding domain-containing protein [Polyangiaceae bacterium]|nr:transposase zinc-binding domain-containing protein [Polyangiaceae bacterium]